MQVGRTRDNTGLPRPCSVFRSHLRGEDPATPHPLVPAEPEGRALHRRGCISGPRGPSAHTAISRARPFLTWCRFVSGVNYDSVQSFKAVRAGWRGRGMSSPASCQLCSGGHPVSEFPFSPLSGCFTEEETEAQSRPPTGPWCGGIQG